MLRRGRIIEIGELDVLRGLASIRVEAELTGIVPDLDGIDGVRHVVSEGRTLRCDVTGPIGPLLRALTDAGVERLTTREPSLEELFIARYGDHDRTVQQGS
jgi:ABC-2 type transport system ATP-binding protein